MADNQLWPKTAVEWTPPRDLAQGGTALPKYNFRSGAGGILLMPGARGFDAPPFMLSYDEMPGIDGAIPRNVRAGSRELFLPLYLYGADRPSMLAVKREFLASLNPAFGPGRLTVTEGDGSSRWIEAHYAYGAEGDEETEVSGFTWCKYGLVLRAMDPYWYSSETVERTFRDSVGDLKPFFSDPFFGLNINRTYTLNQSVTLEVSGDVETWPEWRINGPVSGVTFSRQDAGGAVESFTMDLSLSPTQAAYIDTRPGRKQAILLDGSETNLWEKLGPNPNLWAIKPGSNTVTLAVQGTGVGTSINLSYRPRFISA
ncbi:phage tail domain-containing protein [Planomonospora alba]|uniref:phage tail domain-containing protein n=1 Tax=Planomonospora alba TaxID=161354 RepID=UPI0031F0DCBE